MNLEERQKKINSIVMRLAGENEYITKSQISHAKSLFYNDPRSIEEIESELVKYSNEVRQNAEQKVANEKAAMEQALRTKTVIDDAFAKRQEAHDNGIDEEQVEKTPIKVQISDDEIAFRSNIEEDLSDIYSAPQPTERSGKLGDIVDASNANEDPTDELDSMFETTSQSENDFTQVESMGEQQKTGNKVLVKTTESATTSEQAGFSTISSLVTLASLLSIMGIVISAIIIYTR